MVRLIVPTGYSVLDARIRGISLPSLISVPFDPGSLHRVFLYRLLHSFIRTRGKKIVYLAVDAPPLAIIEELKDIGFDINALINDKKWVFEDLFEVVSGKKQGIGRNLLAYDLRNIFRFYVYPHLEEGSCIMIDSLTYFLLGTPHKGLMKLLFSLKAKLYESESLCILSYLRNAIPRETAGIINHMSDGVLELQVIEDRPILYIPKLRGQLEGLPLLAPYEITSVGIRISTARRA